MPEVIVCAEPETKDEAAEFVQNLGGRPYARAMRSSLKLSRKAQGMLVYLKGTEPFSTLETCLKQISRDKALNVVIYSLHANNQRAAELGRLVGQFRPKLTHICFDSQAVGRILHLRKGIGSAPFVPRKNAATLRKELKLTQSDVADSLGVTSRTVQNWEARGTAPARRLRDLAELHELITAYLEIGERSTWMDGPNQAFGGNTPRSLIREGKTRDLIIEFRRVQIGEPL